MPRKWIDKKNAYNFALVHRSHEDERFYDDDANDGVFVPVALGNQHKKTHKIRAETRDELIQDLQSSDSRPRDNEGQAALYGITYDDSEYDYMKHLKTIGTSNNSVFVPKKSQQGAADHKKGFQLKQMISEDMLPSKQSEYDYQKQQAVPDEISGFRPDLNDDLKEALEALEDPAYLDDSQDVDDVDVFGKLLPHKKQKGLTLGEYEELEEDEWDLDEFEGGDDGDFDWEKDFKKFKKAESSGRIRNDWDTDDEFESEEEDRDVVGDLPDVGGKAKNSKSKAKKAKRKKGASTDASAYSMSSSAMFRTEQMTIIDERFDVMKEKYKKEDDEDAEEEEQPFDFKNERQDFESLIDDFLGNYEQRGKKIEKKDEESAKIRAAADSVSKSKLADRRRRAKKSGVSSLNGLTGKMNKLSI